MEGSIHRVNVYLKSDYYDVSFPRLIVFLADQHIFLQGFVTVNGKRLKKFDIQASNGVIHMITEVIYPFIPDQTIADVVSTDPR